MRSFSSRRRRGALVACTLSLALALSACGGSASSGETTVRFGVFNWDAARVSTQILVQITKKYPELGVDQVELTQVGTTPGWVGLGEGDVDVLAEVAWPNQKPLYQENKDETTLLSKTYDNASQGWFVPSYVVEKGGATPKLESISQLNEYSSVFGGKLYDASAGWITTQQNTARLKGYGVKYQHITSSEGALISQLKASYDDREPLVLYLWHPHWVFAKYDLTQLKEPKPYEEGCFEGEKKACAMPDYSAYVAARKDLQEKAPKFVAFLKEFRLEVPTLEKMLAETAVGGKSVNQVAKQWVQANKSTIDKWVKESTEGKG